MIRLRKLVERVCKDFVSSDGVMLRKSNGSGRELVDRRVGANNVVVPVVAAEQTNSSQEEDCKS